MSSTVTYPQLGTVLVQGGTARAASIEAARQLGLNLAGLYVLQPVAGGILGATLGLDDDVPDGDYVMTPFGPLP